MKKGNIDILVVVFGAATAIFTIKGLLATFWQDLPSLGYVYYVVAGFFGLGWIWAFFIKKEKRTTK